MANNNAVFEIVAGLVVIGLLAWFASVSEHTGYIAVALVAGLWLVWAVNNGSAIGSLIPKL